jgi:hypothetical protein
VQTIKISQSFLKDYNEYKGDNYCGLQLKAKYFDDVEFPSSDAMDLGMYFEYKATNTLPKNNKVPEAKISYAGTKRECISAPYKRADESAKFFKDICDAHNIEIIETGLKLESDNKVGTLDIWGKVDGKPAIIDLKYSGLIDDKWNDRGFDEESLHYKEQLLVQAIQYKMLVHECYGLDYDDFDFYFLVFDSRKVKNVKFLKIILDKDRYTLHETFVESIFKQVNALNINKDLLPKPQINRCAECPIRENCEFKVEVPLIKEIYCG